MTDNDENIQKQQRQNTIQLLNKAADVSQISDSLLLDYLGNFISLKLYLKIKQGKDLIDVLRKCPQHPQNGILIKKISTLVKCDTPEAKLCSMQFIKQAMELCSSQIAHSIQKHCLPHIISVVSYRSNIQSISRGNTMFLNSSVTKFMNDQQITNLMKVSTTFFRMVHECIFVWSQYFPSSQFALAYSQLSQNSYFPMFPQQYKFFNKERINQSKINMQNLTFFKVRSQGKNFKQLLPLKSSGRNRSSEQKTSISKNPQVQNNQSTISKNAQQQNSKIPKKIQLIEELQLQKQKKIDTGKKLSNIDKQKISFTDTEQISFAKRQNLKNQSKNLSKNNDKQKIWKEDRNQQASKRLESNSKNSQSPQGNIKKAVKVKSQSKLNKQSFTKQIVYRQYSTEDPQDLTKYIEQLPSVSEVQKKDKKRQQKVNSRQPNYLKVQNSVDNVSKGLQTLRQVTDQDSTSRNQKQKKQIQQSSKAENIAIADSQRDQGYRRRQKSGQRPVQKQNSTQKAKQSQQQKQSSQDSERIVYDVQEVATNRNLQKNLNKQPSLQKNQNKQPSIDRTKLNSQMSRTTQQQSKAANLKQDKQDQQDKKYKKGKHNEHNKQIAHKKHSKQVEQNKNNRKEQKLANGSGQQSQEQYKESANSSFQSSRKNGRTSQSIDKSRKQKVHKNQTQVKSTHDQPQIQVQNPKIRDFNSFKADNHNKLNRRSVGQFESTEIAKNQAHKINQPSNPSNLRRSMNKHFTVTSNFDYNFFSDTKQDKTQANSSLRNKRLMKKSKQVQFKFIPSQVEKNEQHEKHKTQDVLPSQIQQLIQNTVSKRQFSLLRDRILDLQNIHAEKQYEYQSKNHRKGIQSDMTTQTFSQMNNESSFLGLKNPVPLFSNAHAKKSSLLSFTGNIKRSQTSRSRSIRSRRSSLDRSNSDFQPKTMLFEFAKRKSFFL